MDSRAPAAPGLHLPRRAAFERLDRPPPAPFAEWKRATVHVDDHVELEGHYYSVPHALVGRKVDLRHTATTVEVFHHGQRVAAHAKVGARGRFTTVEAHIPTAHRQALWSPERLLRWAEQTGSHTAAFVTAVLQQSASSRTGLPHLSRRALHPGPAGSRLPAGAGLESPELPQCRFHPGPRPRYPAARSNRRHLTLGPRQSAWPHLLPLTPETFPC